MDYSAVIINWDELSVMGGSTDRLRKEPSTEVIVVDNGSKDGSRDFLFQHPYIRSLLLEENRGNSIARNMAISCARGKYIFLLDGDILYIPGTIETFRKILDANPRYGCIGLYGKYSDSGTEGVPSEYMDTIGDIKTDFPIAWTQYGLFRSEVFRDCHFDETGYYGIPGHGFEDDDLYMQMSKIGWQSAYMTGTEKRDWKDTPRYRHERNTGLNNLKRDSHSNHSQERQKQLENKWKIEWREK